MDQQNSSATLTRRQVFHRITLLLGGAALIDGDQLLAYSFDSTALTEVTAQGAGTFTAADVALLDEIAETILPETTTPGAKAAKTGAFMALMVTDTYTDRNQQVFRDGLQQMDALCQGANGVTFVAATPAQRLALLESLDREQKAVMDQRMGEPVSRTPLPAPASDEPAHYFRMMKELALLGFFTSEVGCTKALRYIEAPGRFDPCAPHAPGDRSWAAHA
ncbi:MAG TPA: gluconate 2-dehydrogenase subunit 3 family protein [Vicinamibacterales bacterium]|jgi:hypothetical protein